MRAIALAIIEAGIGIEYVILVAAGMGDRYRTMNAICTILIGALLAYCLIVGL
jgi:hypothetical protein